MQKIKVIDVSVGLMDENNKIAEDIRKETAKKGIFLVNIMASPGAGKTSVLLQAVKRLNSDYKIGVMEADIDARVDAERMDQAGIRTIQVHTGGECAMDASMTAKALRSFDADAFDLIFLENVGNLVCTAEQDVGADLNLEILSVPEGDDKPLKYPLMFEVADCVLINKIDTLDYFDFDKEKVQERIREKNPRAAVFFISAKTGEGFDEWLDWLRNRMSVNDRF